MLRFLMYFLLVLTMVSCTASRPSFSSTKKYSPDQLKSDFDLFQNLLETHHPGLYWYTPKDSMDFYFAEGKKQLNDSLTEPAFRKVLAWVAAKINCGHTTIRPSKNWSKYSDTARVSRMFPLSMKVWADDKATTDETMVVTANLNRRDTILTRGTVITAINGMSEQYLTDTMFQYISTDGYNRTHKFQSLSNRGYFGSLYTTLFGLPDKFTVNYKDSSGNHKTVVIPAYRPAADTAGRRGTRTFRPTTPQPSKKEIKQQRLNGIRLLKLDTANHTAMMDLASFSKGYGLKSFFKNSFRALKQNNIGHLIIDVRSNGGGSVTNSTLITRYIADSPFKFCDSLYAIKKGSKYEQHIKDHFWNKLFISLLTRKRKDGYYHFGYFERHRFHPKKSNHFDGKVYILTGGNSFSATTLFTGAVKHQENVTVIGEETGGGAYGNSAWLIPDATLAETGVRFRLPLFRLVIDKNIPKDGRGVQPEVASLPTVDRIRRNADFKVEKAMELIAIDKSEKDKNVSKKE